MRTGERKSETWIGRKRRWRDEGRGNGLAGATPERGDRMGIERDERGTTPLSPFLNFFFLGKITFCPSLKGLRNPFCPLFKNWLYKCTNAIRNSDTKVILSIEVECVIY